MSNFPGNFWYGPDGTPIAPIPPLSYVPPSPYPPDPQNLPEYLRPYNTAATQPTQGFNTIAGWPSIGGPPGGFQQFPEPGQGN